MADAALPVRTVVARRTTSKTAVLLTLCLAALIINIDVTIVNVALPSLVRQLGATTTSLQWVVDAYTLVFAALILAAGSLSDRLGRKGVLLAGLGIFAAGSLAGSLCNTPDQLIAARAVMGIGAAGIFPATLSLIANVFTGRAERAKAIGLWGATTGVGVAAGPIVGGWLLEHFWWGSVFLFMVPVAAVVAALVAWTVPTSRDPNIRPVDWPGLLLSSAGMGTLVLSIIEAPDWGWGSLPTITTIAAALLVIAVFVAVERRTERPMMDVSLFKNARFTAASGSITIGFFVLAGFSFLMTQYFQFVKGYSPFATGVRLLPVAISIAVAAVVGTRLAVRVGNNVVVGVGLAMWGGAVLWISTVSASTPYYVIVGQMLAGGGGLGLITAPATEAIMGAVPTEKAGVGSAVNDATRLFGAALGVAVIGSIAASLYGSRLGTTLPHGLPGQAAAAAKGSVGGALVAAKALGAAGLSTPAHALATTAVGAFLHSLSGALHVAGGVALAGAVMAGTLLPARPRAIDAGVLDESLDADGAWVPRHRRLRQAPSMDAPVIGTVQGAVRIVGVDGNWLSVESPDTAGWLMRPLVQPALEKAS
jgi:EmrB/QacA subfamily drug resistance transporter